jgi:hypothetical protein
MNPLAALPASKAPQFSVNKVDMLKILRGFIILVLSSFVTYGVPYLLHLSYSWHGTDYTPGVLIVVNGIAELIRRFLTNPESAATLPVQAAPGP